jgi:hypothetical protein
MENWTIEDAVACYKEGWAPFTCDDGAVEIMALDDPDGVAEDFGFAPFTGQRFATDDDAVEFVEKLAAQGNDCAQRALALLQGPTIQ